MEVDIVSTFEFNACDREKISRLAKIELARFEPASMRSELRYSVSEPPGALVLGRKVDFSGTNCLLVEISKTFSSETAYSSRL